MAATGRGSMNIIGFLATLREIAKTLCLDKNDTVLDIGCGSGIIAYGLSPWVKHIHGIDISQKMIERARKNCSDIPNIAFSEGNITRLGIKGNPFSKIIAYSVLQYLRNEGEVASAFEELSGVLHPKGTALLAANPDPDKKTAYIQAIHNTENADKNMKLVDATLWVDRDRIVDIGESAGLKIEIRDICPEIWQHFYMFNAVVSHAS